MSHFSICRIKIQNPNVELLKLAVEQLAKEMGGETVTEIRDYYGKTMTDFIVALKTPKLYRGVGVKVSKNGTVRLVGDKFGVSEEFNRLQKELVKTYTALALATALKTLGYRVEGQKVNEKVMLYAYS